MKSLLPTYKSAETSDGKSQWVLVDAKGVPVMGVGHTVCTQPMRGPSIHDDMAIEMEGLRVDLQFFVIWEFAPPTGRGIYEFPVYRKEDFYILRIRAEGFVGPTDGSCYTSRLMGERCLSAEIMERSVLAQKDQVSEFVEFVVIDTIRLLRDEAAKRRGAGKVTDLAEVKNGTGL